MSFASDWIMLFNIATGRESLIESRNKRGGAGGGGGRGAAAEGDEKRSE